MNNVVFYAIPAFCLLLLVELLVHRRKANARKNAVQSDQAGPVQKGYETRDTLASLSMGIGNVIISTPVKAVVVIAYFAWLYDFGGWFAETLHGSHWYAWVMLFFADDFCYYWFHRLSHRTNWGWAAHVNHHSSQHYNLSTALRQSWTTPFYSFLFYTPLLLLGFEPYMVFTMMSISLVYQFWIHTEVVGKLGPLEWVMNTPSHHRVHHGSDDIYLDKNYGGTMIIYDRLFGSFQREQHTPRYGLTVDITTFNPLKIASHQWLGLGKEMRQSYAEGGLRAAFKKAWVPPGQ